MTPKRLFDLCRSHLADTAEPYMWPDADIWLYMDEAQKEFCKRTDGISDASTPEVVRLSVVPGQEWVPLHQDILKIRGARFSDTGKPVKLMNYEDAPRLDSRAGLITALVIGMEEHVARAYPIPSAAAEMTLLVFRLPLDELSETSTKFEISEEFHLTLLLWMKHLAYSKQDAETFDKGRADEFEARFIDKCRNDRDTMRRKRHKPRLIQYGGL